MEIYETNIQQKQQQQQQQQQQQHKKAVFWCLLTAYKISLTIRQEQFEG